MNVYKYVTGSGLLRYLRSEALRITPPNEFNDPFEMSPTLDFDYNEMVPGLQEAGKQELLRVISEGLSKEAPAVPAGLIQGLSQMLTSFVLQELSPDKEAELLGFMKLVNPDFSDAGLQFARSQAPALKDGILRMFPAISSLVQSTMPDAMSKAVGVLCLSGSERHPLMWAHYADSHQGAMLEFDSSHRCFNRKRAPDDELGRLHRVWYSDARPSMSNRTGDHGMAVLALTKALEWAYEQELRLLWPLKDADTVIPDKDGKHIHLITVPLEALTGVTLGCRAPHALTKQVAEALRSSATGRSVRLRTARLDSTSFGLVYSDVD